MEPQSRGYSVTMSRHTASADHKSKTLNDKYLLGDEICKGTYGRVYRGLDLENGDFVAIKQVSLENIPAEDLASIQQEIDLLKNLNHKNIVKYQGSFKTKSHLYIILEYVENGSLANIIKPNKFGAFPESLVALYITQVLEGLVYLHEQGVIHRDIKGANILTTKEGLVKLADFRVATKLTEADVNTHSVVGTPYWMAPEVIEMSGVSAASDIWSVGCTVIELLTCVPPYYDLQPMLALFRIVQDDHPPLPEHASPGITDFLRQCFRKDAKLRPDASTLLNHPWIRNSSQTLKNSLQKKGGINNIPEDVSIVVERALEDGEKGERRPPSDEDSTMKDPFESGSDDEQKLALSLQSLEAGALSSSQSNSFGRRACIRIPKSQEVISDQGLIDDDLGRVAEIAHLPRTFVVEDFIREVNKGGGDGYFMSSQWLLSLSEHERDTLMLCLRRAGYSETCQTTTTVLFARTENDAIKNSTTDFACPEDIDEGGNDLLGIEGEVLDTENYVAIADAVGSNNPLETSSSIQQGLNLVNIFPAKRQATTLESFRATVKSKVHQSFCINTMWLLNLEDHERETLLTFMREVGYKRTSETDNTTWYERIQECKRIQAGGACDTDIPSSSTKNDVASGLVKQSTVSKLLGFSNRKRMVDRDDDASDSSHMATTAMERNKVKDDNSTCHEQILRVECSSSTSQTPGEVHVDGDFFRQQFGDSVGKWPVSKSEAISTSIEKSFRIPTLHFLTDQGGTEVPTQVLMNLKASATISLSCCLRIYHNSQKTRKIRMKFSQISAEIKNNEAEDENEESHGESQEEFCNAIALSYLCTNVYSGCQSRQILLHLEDEYDCPPGIRVIVNDQHLWLENSGITPINPDPGSTSLVLRCDVRKRRRRDSGIPYPLHFQEARPVIFEGDIKFTLLQESFLKFRIRHKLEVSYFRPSRPILNQGSAWSANSATKVINFDCFFDISIDNISVG